MPRRVTPAVARVTPTGSRQWPADTSERAAITDYHDHAEKVEIDLDHAWNRTEGASSLVFEGGSPLAMDESACAYPAGADQLTSPAYHIDDHQLTWTLATDGFPTVDLHVTWRGIWLANVDEVYGCIDDATALASAPDGDADGELVVEATFGAPVFTAGGAPGGDGWTAWAATLPVAFRIRSGRSGELVRGWLLDAEGHAHAQYGA